MHNKTRGQRVECVCLTGERKLKNSLASLRSVRLCVCECFSVCVVPVERIILCHQAITIALLGSVSSHVKTCVFTLL